MKKTKLVIFVLASLFMTTAFGVLAVLDHIFISIFSKIIAVCFFSMNDKDCTSDFITVL